MVSVDVAMRRSLRPDALTQIRNIFARFAATGLRQRDVLTDAEGKITDAKTAFSSWDNCMKASFCKWPVVAVIAVGGLIIFSIVWCIIRCCCCGVSCCCSCFQCFKCCGNCCGCCDPPRGARNKYLDAPFVPPHHQAGGQAYQYEAPMRAPFAPQSAAPPQYAEFEVHKGGEDALPSMPSWDNSGTRKVDTGHEELEMNDLRSPNTQERQPLYQGGRPNSNTPSIPPQQQQQQQRLMHHEGRPGLYSPLSSTHPSPLSSPFPSPLPHSPIGMSRASPSPNPYGSPRPVPNDYVQPFGQSQAYNPPTPPLDHNYNVQNPADNRASVGFGLDEPYDTIPNVSETPNLSQQQHQQQRQQELQDEQQRHRELQQPHQQQQLQDEQQYHELQQPQHEQQAMHEMPSTNHLRRGPVEMPVAIELPAEMPAGPFRSSGDNYSSRDQPLSPFGPGQNAPIQSKMQLRGPSGSSKNDTANYGTDPRMKGSPAPGPYSPGTQRGPGTPGPREHGFNQSPRQASAVPQDGSSNGPSTRRPNHQERMNSPGPRLQNPMNRAYSPNPNRSPRGQDNQAFSAIPPSGSRGFAQRRPERSFSPVPPGTPPARQYSPAPPHGQYPPYSERRGTPDRELRSNTVRNFSPAPPKMFSPPREAPLANSSGFDFSSDSTQPAPRMRPGERGEKGYPGHKPYRPM